MVYAVSQILSKKSENPVWALAYPLGLGLMLLARRAAIPCTTILPWIPLMLLARLHALDEAYDEVEWLHMLPIPDIVWSCLNMNVLIPLFVPVGALPIPRMLCCQVGLL